MQVFKQVRNPELGDSVTDSILWPFVLWPMIWVLLIHVGTRIMWLIGYK